MLLNRSWGARGHPFAQHYSCPTVLRCSIGSTSGGCGDISLCGKNCCLNRTAQKAAFNRQGGNIRVAALYAQYSSFPAECVAYTVRSVRVSARFPRSAEFRNFLDIHRFKCYSENIQIKRGVPCPSKTLSN